MKLNLLNVTWPASCLLIGFALDIDAFAYIGMCCSEVFCQQTMFWKRLSVGFSRVWGESIWLPRTMRWELSLDIILSYFTEVAFRAFCIWSLQLLCDETFLSWWGWSLAEWQSIPSIWFNEFENDGKHMQWSSQSNHMITYRKSLPDVLQKAIIHPSTIIKIPKVRQSFERIVSILLTTLAQRFFFPRLICHLSICLN